ncbi:MAG: L,D-transpeptidase [Pseudomonadota bacterium]
MAKFLRNAQSSQNGMSTEDFLRQNVFVEKKKNKKTTASSNKPMNTEDYLKYEVFGVDEDESTVYQGGSGKVSKHHGTPEEILLKNKEGFAEYDMDEIIVDHEKGTFDIYRGGKLQKTYPYTSGRDGETDQTKRGQGPTPSGTYYINPKDASERTWSKRLVDAYRNTDWGRFRVPMIPDEGNELYGRSGFFVHGGDEPGSAGCLDLGEWDSEFFYNLGNTDEEVKITVK